MKSIIKTKLIAFSILIALIILPALQSCNKYADGPAFSLRMRSHRVVNTWKIENYKMNGNDYTSFVSNYYETFSKNGAFTYSWDFIVGSGKWAFQNDDMEIKLNGDDDHSSRTLYILKLEEDAFWYYYKDGDDKHEYHLVSK